MDFEIIGEIAAVETIAVGTGIRNLRRLQKRYGRGALAQVQRICEDSLAERGTSCLPKSIGTSQPASASANSRSNATCNG
jgi:hypothetical protein